MMIMMMRRDMGIMEDTGDTDNMRDTGDIGNMEDMGGMGNMEYMGVMGDMEDRCNMMNMITDNLISERKDYFYLFIICKIVLSVLIKINKVFSIT